MAEDLVFADGPSPYLLSLP